MSDCTVHGFPRFQGKEFNPGSPGRAQGIVVPSQPAGLKGADRR